MKYAVTILFFLGYATSAAAAEPSFTGTWDTTFGRMTLTQDGQKVQGFYLMNGQRCPVEGQVEKSKLTFRYQEGDTKGEGWYELAADGQSFKGQWREIGAQNWQPWEGKRVTALAKAAMTFDGVWETSYGRMRLVQRDTQVDGIYSYTASSIITGKVEGKKLTFTYKEPKAEGEAWFELADDGRSFHGKWKEKGKASWADWVGQRVEPIPGVTWLVVIEANWEHHLAEPEYSFGAMLRAFFARSPNVHVRHRFFTDEASLKRWCQEVTYLAEPVVVSLATHGSKAGLQVNGTTIGGKAIADSFRYASNLRVLQFSACELMKDKVAREIIDSLDKQRRFPISGYTTVVDWAGSAIVEFTYYELILCRNQSPEAALKQVLSLMPFAGDGPLPGSAFKPLGFRILMPGEDKASAVGK